MNARIYINRHKVKANKASGSDEPTIAIRTYKGVEYAKKVKLQDAVLIQDFDNPICSGATIWLECDRDNVIIES